MAPRFLTVLTSRNLPKIRQSGEAEPSTINDKTIADFRRAWLNKRDFWGESPHGPVRVAER